MTKTTRMWIIVEAVINQPVSYVWESWTKPEHIVNWYFASEDWCAPRAENDVREGGHFLTRMEAKDGSFGFNMTGTYDEVVEYKKIAYSMGDGRKVVITFVENGNETKVTESFEAEGQNPIEMQQAGWQAILNQFKLYTEQL